MKKAAILLFFVCVATAVGAQQNFEVMTKKPVAGSEITIEYMPRNTVLQGHSDFDAIAYLLEGKTPLAKSITLKQEGGIFRGKVKTNDTTKAVFFSFVKDELRDNNNDEGYFTVLHDRKGNVAQGSNLAIGNGFTNYASLWDMKRNKEKGAIFLKKEFANPAAKAVFSNEYLVLLSQSTDEKDKALLREELAKSLQKKDLPETDLMNIKGFYLNALADKESADAIMAQVKERFPKGSWKRREVVDEFFKAKSLVDKEKVFNRLLLEFGPTKKEDQDFTDYMAGQVARGYADSGNYTAAKKYISLINSTMSQAGAYNGIAWKLSGGGLSKKPIDIQTGMAFSEQAMALVNKEMQERKHKYPFLTDKQYSKNLTSSYHSYADTYAVLLYHEGEFEKAYALSKKAVENYKRSNSNLNENFAFLTEKVKGKKEALAELEKFLEEGKHTPAMKEQLKTIYLAGNKTEAQWTAYVNTLEETAYNKLKAELLKKMINMPAPQFALKDLTGKEVALSSLKGKVVVVDFWATWCSPCIASFPGMQKAVDRFKSNPDVVFLFIDTWENDSNRVQKVTDFIAKNKYPFQVLYDEAKSKEGNDFTVIEDYKVDGIPTKFVIDRNNNIRFKSVGYNGSAEGTLSEMTAMIDLAAAESGEPFKKAF